MAVVPGGVWLRARLVLTTLVAGALCARRVGAAAADDARLHSRG